MDVSLAQDVIYNRWLQRIFLIFHILCREIIHYSELVHSDSGDAEQKAIKIQSFIMILWNGLSKDLQKTKELIKNWSHFLLIPLQYESMITNLTDDVKMTQNLWHSIN